MDLQYKGINIHYTKVGSGIPVILLHGFIENSSMWKCFTPKLSKTNTVICIDLLGHGLTDCLGYVHRMDVMADVVKCVLQHLKVVKCYVVGHSMGGYVGLSLAKQNPDLILGLCLLNSTFEADSEARKLLRTRAVVMAKNNYKNLLRLSFVNLFSEHSRQIHSKSITHALHEALKTSVQGYIAATEGMKLREDMSTYFCNAPFKKHIIVGKQDQLINYKHLMAMAKKHHFNFSALEGGHMSTIEATPSCLQEIKTFLI